MAQGSNPSRHITFWDRLVAIAEARPEVKALNRLNAISDEELAAHGKTRAGEMRRVLGSRYIG